MKAYVSGNHYHLHIDRQREFELLADRQLEASLQDGSDGSNVGKKVILVYDRSALDAYIEFVPQDAIWSHIQELRVKITRTQYEMLGIRGSYVHSFGGGCSIDLILDEDIDGLI